MANDLKEYGKGYSIQNLKRMSQLAKEFASNEFGSQPVSQIPWSTLSTIIMPKSSSHKEMLWYISETHRNGWSRAMVMNQFAMKAYERSLIKPSTTKPVMSDDSTNELFKDTYVFSFLDRDRIVSEKDLKEQLINNVISFLQELGPGFSLVGKEYRLVTPSEKEFFIDLLMYHTKIHCYIVIEVKIGEFSPSDLGQLAFYVNAINKLERTEGDNETIGLILCKEADRFVAETTLESSLMKLGISKFKFIEELPEYLNKKLLKKENKYEI